MGQKQKLCLAGAKNDFVKDQTIAIVGILANIIMISVIIP